MSEQDNGQISTLQCPSIHDRAIQKIYWEKQGQPWRTEPEISAERQEYLEDHRHSIVKERKYVLPLKDTPLSRADIEWLLATHENGRGPVAWNDLGQRKRLDLHGLDLRGVDLSELPLANAHLMVADFSLVVSDLTTYSLFSLPLKPL